MICMRADMACGDMPAACGDMPAACGDMPAACGDIALPAGVMGRLEMLPPAPPAPLGMNEGRLRLA